MASKKSKPKYLTAEEIRAMLLRRVNAYAKLTDTSISRIGKLIKNDSSVYTEIERGRNFTIDLYDATMKWLDDNWPVEAT